MLAFSVTGMGRGTGRPAPCVLDDSEHSIPKILCLFTNKIIVICPNISVYSAWYRGVSKTGGRTGGDGPVGLADGVHCSMIACSVAGMGKGTGRPAVICPAVPEKPGGRTGGDGPVGLIDGVDLAVVVVVDGLRVARQQRPAHHHADEALRHVLRRPREVAARRRAAQHACPRRAAAAQQCACCLTSLASMACVCCTAFHAVCFSMQPAQYAPQLLLLLVRAIFMTGLLDASRRLCHYQGVP